MSALWSITFIKTESSIRKVFATIKESFSLEIDDKLYISVRQDESWVDVKTDKAITEEFHNRLRAKMMTDSLILERYNPGVLVYPEQNGLIALVDSIIDLGHIYHSSRKGRAELINRMRQKPDKDAEALFLYMNFLRRVSNHLSAEMVHIMFERSPATRCTSVHVYSSGEFLDDYYFEDVECEDRYGLIELPNKPNLISKLLDGRIAFLADQPRIRIYDDEYSREVYFDGEDLSGYPHNPTWDVFNLKHSEFCVPFWDDEAKLPFGAIYCPVIELPGYFLERYKN